MQLYERFIEDLDVEEIDDYNDFSSRFRNWMGVLDPEDAKTSEAFVKRVKVKEAASKAEQEVWNRYFSIELKQRKKHVPIVTRVAPTRAQILALPYYQRKKKATYIKSHMRGKIRVKGYWRLRRKAL